MKEFLKYTFATIVGLFITFIFLGVLLFFTVMGLISSAGKETAHIKDNSILELEIDYDVQERGNKDFMAILNKSDDHQIAHFACRYQQQHQTNSWQ